MQKENKRNILLMLFITFFQGIVVYSTIATLYRQQRGLSLSDFAMIEGWFFIFTLLFEIPFGMIADQIGYKKTLVCSNLIYLLSKVVFWKAYGFGWFLLERLLLAMAMAGLSGVDSSLLFLSSKKEQSQLNFSLYQAFGNAGMLLSSLLFTVFFYNNYSGSAFATVLCYLIAAILTLFLEEVSEETSHTSFNLLDFGKMVKVTLKDVRFLFFLFACALLSSSSWIISVMINQVKYIDLGLSTKQIGILHTLFSFIGLFSISSAFFTQKLGFRRFLLFTTFVLALFSLWMGYTQSSIIAIIANLLCELSYSLIIPLITDLQNQHVFNNQRATQLSIYAMIVDLFSFFLNGLLSLVATISTNAIFILACSQALLAMVLIQICYGKQNHENPSQVN